MWHRVRQSEMVKHIGELPSDIRYRVVASPEDELVGLRENGGALIYELTRRGYDVEMTTAVRAVVSVPLVASGGAGRVEDFAPAVDAGADAVLAASVFHFGELAIPGVKDALAAAGHPVRRGVSAG